jgi:hypothetical protein
MSLKHMASRTMRLAYDRDSDVLYIGFWTAPIRAG